MTPPPSEPQCGNASPHGCAVLEVSRVPCYMPTTRGWPATCCRGSLGDANLAAAACHKGACRATRPPVAKRAGITKRFCEKVMRILANLANLLAVRLFAPQATCRSRPWSPAAPCSHTRVQARLRSAWRAAPLGCTSASAEPALGCRPSGRAGRMEGGVVSPCQQPCAANRAIACTPTSPASRWP